MLCVSFKGTKKSKWVLHIIFYLSTQNLMDWRKHCLSAKVLSPESMKACCRRNCIKITVECKFEWCQKVNHFFLFHHLIDFSLSSIRCWYIFWQIYQTNNFYDFPWKKVFYSWFRKLCSRFFLLLLTVHKRSRPEHIYRSHNKYQSEHDNITGTNMSCFSRLGI